MIYFFLGVPNLKFQESILLIDFICELVSSSYFGIELTILNF